ncbi:MAG: hypothetical protein SOX38_11555, partial [Candidatus Limiplasma sp.]|nr:hypothetical protein [Candidatus Limiplasma sp.]
AASYRRGTTGATARRSGTISCRLASTGRHSATGLMAGIPLKLLWYIRQYNKAGNVFQSFGKHSLLLYLLACFRK